MFNVRSLPRARATRVPVALDVLPEDELVLAYLVHDDERAFRELYRRVAPYLLAVAQRRVRSPEIAADLVQQAFLNAHAARDRFELGSAFRPWITRILVNLAWDQRRTARRRPLADIDPAELAAPSPADSPERLDEVARARRALDSLRPAQRRVIEMHWLEERPFPEVAEALGERLSTVKVRAHRAYHELRRVLDPASA
ncbi:MAG TPA: RNA polymerase sigma factor [Polyangiaceae bacterium]